MTLRGSIEYRYASCLAITGVCKVINVVDGLDHFDTGIDQSTLF